MLTLPGSDLMNALFLPSGSTVLVPCRKVNVIENSNEIRIWFRQFPFLRAIEICGDNDVTFEGQTAILSVPAMVTYMDDAIKDWHRRKQVGFN